MLPVMEKSVVYQYEIANLHGIVTLTQLSSETFFSSDPLFTEANFLKKPSIFNNII